jgi:glycosyltransferase involved in cell wall biosynthesis
MRVLHVHSGNLYGGVETMLLALAHYSPPDMAQEFALSYDARIAAELRGAKATVHILGEARTRNPLSIRRARTRLCEVLAGGFDAAICHMPWSQAMFAPAVRRAATPLVFWMHGAAGGHWLERWAARHVPDLIICNSRFTSTTGETLYPRTRAEVLNCPMLLKGVPADRGSREQVRRELATPAGDVAIIQVSRMEPWKGHFAHLDALARLRDCPRWVCWMIGGAQRPHERRYMKKLHAHAVRLGIAERVRFAGERADVPRLLNAADIFCQPNTGAEPFGIVFIEALAAGLPVITTAIGAAPEIIGPQCGMLTPPNDTGALADALRRLITDREARRRLGAGGPDRARSLCDPEQQTRKLGRILAMLVYGGASGESGARPGANVSRETFCAQARPNVSRETLAVGNPQES